MFGAIFGRKKTDPKPEESFRTENLREDIELSTATSLVASGAYKTLEEAVMETIAEGGPFGSIHNFAVSDEEAAAYDNGSELAEARTNLENALGLSDEQIGRIFQSEYDQDMQYRQQRIARMRERIGRLNAVLEQASRWTPPDELSDSFKQKFVEQITADVLNTNRDIELLGSEHIYRPSISEYRERLVKNRRERVEILESKPSWRAYSSASKAKRYEWVEALRQSFAPQSHA